jgi:protein phosphatase methylesterase 1
MYWREWFVGLTKAFLEVRVPKLLLIAEKERMDKELTIA